MYWKFVRYAYVKYDTMFCDYWGCYYNLGIKHGYWFRARLAFWRRIVRMTWRQTLGS